MAETNYRPKSQVIDDLTKAGPGALKGRMENGVRIIEYCFPEEESRDGNVSLLPIKSENQINRVRKTFDEIESFANVKFVRVDKPLSDIDLYIGSNMPVGKPAYAYTGEYKFIAMQRDNYSFDRSVAHEIGHALGLTHPAIAEEHKKFPSADTNGLGGNAYYDKTSTVMSYNTTGKSSHEISYGPADVLALQHLYGKAKNPSPHRTVNIASMPSTIVSDEIVTVEVGEHQPKGTLTLPAAPKDGLVRTFANSRVGYDTQVNHITVSPGNRASQALQGNEAQNNLSGGSGDDSLTAEGHGDVLKGGKGSDTFNLLNDTIDTRITDFNAREGDKVWVAPNTSKATLEEQYRGRTLTGTQMAMFDHKKNKIATAFFQSARAEDIKPQLLCEEAFEVDTVQPKELGFIPLPPSRPRLLRRLRLR